jgi:sestrin
MNSYYQQGPIPATFYSPSPSGFSGMNVNRNEIAIDSLISSIEQILEELFLSCTNHSHNQSNGAGAGSTGYHAAALVASPNDIETACYGLERLLADFINNNNNHIVHYPVNSSSSPPTHEHTEEMLLPLSKLRHWADKCPYGAIRDKLTKFFEQHLFSKLGMNGYSPPPVSLYIPYHDIDKHTGLQMIEEKYHKSCHQKLKYSNGNGHDGSSIDELSNKSNSAEDEHSLFVHAFHVFSLRLPNFVQLLGYHPKYLREFLNFHESLFYEGGTSLDLKLITYLGIMACASFDCQYLMEVLKETLPADDEFVLYGLPGISRGGSDRAKQPKASNVQYDLQALVHINHILAFTPWKLKSSDIADIVKVQWPLDKLVEAIIVLAHFHSLCCFVLACGVTADHPAAASVTTRAQNSDWSENGPGLSHRLGDDHMERPNSQTSNCSSNGSKEGIEGTQFIQQLRKMPIKNHQKAHFQQVAQIDLAPERCKEGGPVSSRQLSDTNLKYVGLQRTNLEPFVQTDEYRMLFTCEEGVNEVLDTICSSNSNLLTAKIQARIQSAFNLTYNRYGMIDIFGDELSDVDTSSFRRAIPCTCLLTNGICYDDFNYDLVQFVMDKCPEFFKFLKMALVDPQSVDKHLFAQSFPYGLDHSEKVHICILVMEARMQIELFYAMKAINSYRFESTNTSE